MGYRNFRPKKGGSKGGFKPGFKPKGRRFASKRGKEDGDAWVPTELKDAAGGADSVNDEPEATHEPGNEKYAAASLMRALRRGAGCLEVAGDLSKLSHHDRDLIEIKAGGRIGLVGPAYKHAKTMATKRGPDQEQYAAVLKAARSLMNQDAPGDAVEPAVRPEKTEPDPLETAIGPNAEAPVGEITPEVITEVLSAANVLARAGQDLTSLPNWQQELVAVQPATRPKTMLQIFGKKKIAVPVLLPGGHPDMEPNPLAGRVGLTPAAIAILQEKNGPNVDIPQANAPAKPAAVPFKIRWLPKFSWPFGSKNKEASIDTSLTFSNLRENVEFSKLSEDDKQKELNGIKDLQKILKWPDTKPIPFSSTILSKLGSKTFAWLVSKLGPADQALLSIAAQDGAIVVRRAVAKNPATNPDDLDVLCRDPDEDTRGSVALNPSATATDALFTLMLDTESAIRAAVAKNQMVTDEQMEILSRDADPIVRVAVANEIDAPKEVLTALASDPDPTVATEAKNNPGTPKLATATPTPAVVPNSAEKMVVLAAEQGALTHLPASAFLSLQSEALKTRLKSGSTLADALVAQINPALLLQAPQLLTPAVTWQLAKKDMPGPDTLSEAAKLAFLSPEALQFQPSLKETSLAQLLANGKTGGEWAMAMDPETIKNLYSDATLAKLEAEVGKLIPQDTGAAKDRLFIDGAQLQHGEKGITASGGLGVVLALSLTPAAMSLKNTIEAANNLEAYLPKPKAPESPAPTPPVPPKIIPGTEEKMVLLAAERNALMHLPLAVFAGLKPEALKTPMKDGKTLSDAILAQVQVETLLVSPRLLTPDVAWRIAQKGIPTPTSLLEPAVKAFLAPDAIAYRPTPKDFSIAQLLANGPTGAEWASAMDPEVVETLYSESVFEKLESEVIKLIPQDGVAAKDVLFVGGAQLLRGEHGIIPSGGLGVALNLSRTPAAQSLKTTLKAANDLEEFLPKVEKTVAQEPSGPALAV